MRHEALPGDHVDASLLKAGPVRLLDLGSNLGQLIGRELASPVSLNGLFDLTVCAYKKAATIVRSPVYKAEQCKSSPMRGKPRTLERTMVMRRKEREGSGGEEGGDGEMEERREAFEEFAGMA